MAELLAPAGRGSVSTPWVLGYVVSAARQCGYEHGKRFRELEALAHSYRHPRFSNEELVKQGVSSFHGSMRMLGKECECRLALDHFGQHGRDFDGTLAAK